MTQYAWINLAKSNYTAKLDYKILDNPDSEQLLGIYKQYCTYKKFKSAWPIYAEEFTNPANDIIGYYDNNELVAWSMMYKINARVIEALQFAWNYNDPKLKLGIESMKCECAIYKAQGYEYIILGEAHEYKKQIDGFEIIGPAI
jgi:hypothetical protein